MNPICRECQKTPPYEPAVPMLVLKGIETFVVQTYVAIEPSPQYPCPS